MMRCTNAALLGIFFFCGPIALVAVSDTGAQPPSHRLDDPMGGLETAARASVWVETVRPASVAARGRVENGIAIVQETAELSTHPMAPHVGVITPDGSPEREDALHDDEFIPLFDGETLNGWVVENSDANNFSVQDGILRVDGPGGWLRSEETYSDFDLKVEFRFLTDDADSGVFVRVDGSESTFARGWPAGSYQVQTRDVSTNRTERPLLLGNIYRHGMPEGATEFDADAAFAASADTGEWQTFEIEVVGDSLRVALNGTPITHARDIANPSGFIGIQGETDTVEFRAIEIREK